MHSSPQDIISIQETAYVALMEGRITTAQANRIIKESRRAIAVAAADISARMAASRADALSDRANLHRRHPTETARGMIAVDVANVKAGRNWGNSANLRNKVTQPEAAAMLKVSERTVRSCKVVRDRGSPRLVARARRGDLIAAPVRGISPNGLPKAKPEIRSPSS
jgi:transcription initiation factor TFIIIB Brf1 subunit/transcription initiation factor TFIIB